MLPRIMTSSLTISIHDDRNALGRASAALAARELAAACRRGGSATLVVATGSSQFEVLRELAADPGIPWPAITIFHLDEYIGLTPDHPASFRRFLRDRLIDRLPVPPAAFHELDGCAEPAAECRRLELLVPSGDFDVALIGIGENGHLAFNDPPADFATTAPYHVVSLAEACRQQQVGEGWFATLVDVPNRALSMSVRRILATKTLICSVPDRRKAEAVRTAVAGPVTPAVPASILQQHPRCYLHLDRESAALFPGDAVAGA